MLNRLLAILLGTLTCTMAAAQSLDDRVRELERRVEQLEQQVGKQPAAAAGANRSTGRSGGSRQLENWRSLRRGMSEADVRSILGEPHKVNVMSSMGVWYYDPPVGGNVHFDGGGKVEGWSEPRR
jgi:hypothetical protein